MSKNRSRTPKHAFDINKTQLSVDINREINNKKNQLADDDDYLYFYNELKEKLENKKVKMTSNSRNMSTILDIENIECDYFPNQDTKKYPMHFHLKDGKVIDIYIPTDLRVKNNTYILDYSNPNDNEDEKYITKTFKTKSEEKKIFDLEIKLEII
jgi:hypothetical protein